MTDYQKLTFYNPTCGNIKFDQVIEEVFNYIKSQPDNAYEIVAGCDSSSGENPNFPVALVILRKGQGGRFFLTKVSYKGGNKKFYSFRQRILEEIYLSCELALCFREALKLRFERTGDFSNYKFAYIHADIGASGKTRDMIKEVVGLIKSNGFEAKIKPESFAASVVADRFT